VGNKFTINLFKTAANLYFICEVHEGTRKTIIISQKTFDYYDLQHMELIITCSFLIGPGWLNELGS
jgi:hypothetical protein